MAWLSVGTSNKDLIQKMIQNGVFEEGPILEAFRATDRGDFVNPEDRIQAYSDRPFKRGFIHLSAPHMYATVLKALDLKSGKSFLNIGSGSGYLSCLAAFLLGEEGVSHGVEISEAASQFSREKAKSWHSKLMSKLKEDEESLGTPMPSVISSDGIAFVTANCFDIDVLSAVSTMKYDRIYIGAGCPESRKEFFLSMLADNGIMVAPINEKNQMIVIRKFCGRVYNSKPISQVNFAPLLDTTVRADEPALLAELASMESNASLNSDIQQTIQKVQAASASSSFIFHPLPFPSGAHLQHDSGSGSGGGSGGSSPSSAVLSPGSSMHASGSSNSRLLTEETVVRVRLPALVWAPLRRRHLQFPPDFRRAVFTILLANNQAHQYSPHTSYPHQQQQLLLLQHYHHRAGPAERAWACLPHHIWLFIFTFASRDWFCVPKSEVQALSTELAVERRLRRSAEDKLRKAETARRTAEQERDMYRIALARLKQHNKHHNGGGTGSTLGATSLGAALWAHASSSENEFDEADEDEDEEEEEDEEDEGFGIEEEEEWNEEMDEGLDDVAAVAVAVAVAGEGEAIEEEGEDEEDGDSVTISDGNSSNSDDEVQEQGEEEQGEEQGGEGGEVQDAMVVGAAAAVLDAPPLSLSLHSQQAMAMEVTSPMSPSLSADSSPFAMHTSISTASVPSSTWEQEPLHANSSSNGNGNSSSGSNNGLAWFAPPFAGPITQPPTQQDFPYPQPYLYHHYHNHSQQYQYLQLQQGGAGAGVVAGSLSSDATCTTVESSSHSLSLSLGTSNSSSDPSMAEGTGVTARATGRRSMNGGANSTGNTIATATTNDINSSRATRRLSSFSAEERISDCTDTSSAAPNGQDGEGEEEGEGYGFDTSEQFTTDELL